MYTPHTRDEIEAMLGAIGVASLDELLRVPDAVAFKGALDVPAGLPETELAADDLRLCGAQSGGDGVRFVPRRRRVPALLSAGRYGARDAR